MPRLTLEQVKAQQREAIRLRTERRLAELKVEQGKRDWEEVLTLCAFLWLSIIVWILYNGEQHLAITAMLM